MSHSEAAPWDRDYFIHCRILEELRSLGPNIVLFTDLDEIPRPDVVERFTSQESPIMALYMDVLIFFWDRQDPGQLATARIAQFQGVEPDRHDKTVPVLLDAGWHCEYMGGRELLLHAINSNAHAGEPGGRDFWQRVNAGQYPGLERSVPYPTKRLPAPVQKNPRKWKSKGWFYEE